MPKRTRNRILFPVWELEHRYHIKKEEIPDCMELLDDGIQVAVYLTEEQAKEREGQLFPRCPVTDAFCVWDTDWPDLFDLL